MNIIGLYLVTVLIWGSTWFVITFQIGDVHEAVSVFYRFFSAGVLMLGYCLVAKKNLRFSLRQHGYMALQGCFLFCLNYLLIYYGTAYIASGLVAVVFSTLAILNIVNGAVFLKKPVQPIVLVGALLGLLGIGLVFSHELAVAQESVGSGDVLLGFVIVLAATYSASLGNIVSARNQQAGMPILQTCAFGTLYGSAILFVYGQVVGANFNIEWTMSYTLALLYLSVFGTIIAFGAYLSLVGKIGADKAGYAMVVFPIVALLISTVFEGFVWTPIALLGMGFVVAGNIVVVGSRHVSRYFQKAGSLKPS